MQSPEPPGLTAALVRALTESQDLVASLRAKLTANLVASLRAKLTACEGARVLAAQRAFNPDVFPFFFRIPFAGDSVVPSPDSVLSHCYGALLPMFTTEEATVLRLVCKEFKEAVAALPWEDRDQGECCQVEGVLPKGQVGHHEPAHPS